MSWGRSRGGLRWRLAALPFVAGVCVLFAIAAAPARAALVYDQWSLRASGTTQNLQDVAANGATAWAVGAAGTIRVTTDGGETWAAQTSGTTQALYAVVFTNAQTGWIAGGGGVILHTTNGGATWVKQTSGTTQALLALDFKGQKGWAVGSRGTIRHTDNGGSTWSAQTSGTTQGLNFVAFADAANGWVGGARGTQRHTADGGKTWTAVNLAKQQSLNAALFTDAANGWEVGSKGVIRHTGDGGVNWAAQSSGTTKTTLYAAAFLDAQAGWVTGAGGAIRHTVNGGAAWTTEASHTTTTLRGAACAGPYAYAVGDGGVIDGFVADTIPPVTTATGLQPDQLSGWTKDNVQVSLAATDVGVGVAAIYYAVNGGATQTYKNPFTISTPGGVPVTYWAVDKDGNTEAVHTGWVNIGNPFAQATGLAADDHSGWRNTAATVTITGGGDNPPFTVFYTVDGAAASASSPAGFQVTGVGRHTVTFYVRNSKGAESTPHLTGYVNIETTPPVTTAGPVPSGWKNAAISVPLAAADALSGVASTSFRIDTGAWQIASGAAVVPAPADHSMDGTRTVSYRSTDVAGNVEEAQQFVVHIDTRRPGVRAPYSAAVARNHTVALRCKVTDKAPSAGRATVKIVIKNRVGKAVKKLTRANMKTGVMLRIKYLCKLRAGSYRFFVYATDAAGNPQVKVASNRLTVR